MNRTHLLLIFFLFVVMRIFSVNPPASEVRAVWLTTNYGLDWPRNRISQEVQKRELIAILDNLQKHNFNTVIFQVRARGEMFYDSKIEPMASVIAPSGYGNPKFDPLAFAIEECHKRGMELHAWIVTYPLGLDKHVRSLGAKSVTKKNPSITRKYRGEWFLDPGNPKTDDYLLSIVKEIVLNYDIDGIHFDYIRYPDNTGKFPDAGMYRLYGKGKTLYQWRRDNITRFVTKAYDWVKSQKKWVQVSSAPLGRYRALGNTGAGWTALETVFQDAATWLKMGKHDALYPMMYYKDHLFYPFVDDWLENGNKRIIVPGLGTYQMIELGWSRQDIVDQMDYTRKNESAGQAYFRTDNVLSNTKGILNTLDQYYRYPAKLPAMTWLSDEIPEAPYDLTAESINGKLLLNWKIGDAGARVTYNVYRSESEDFDVHKAENILATGLRKPFFEYAASVDEKGYYYYVTVSDSYHNESEICCPAFFVHSETVK
ncbi:glycoside hydrolase family 10 protein [Petrimonas sp.]|uniref:glycoside hydrolase family 10 protein n=1 Tax=Petrimonas sp. TaxID=2023866 RepID=UPI002FCBEDEA